MLQSPWTWPGAVRLIGLCRAALAFPNPRTQAQESETAAQMSLPASYLPAQPIELKGVPNLHRVSATLYRSAQPDMAGFALLERHLGIKTTVSLRAFHFDAPLMRHTKIKLVSIRIHTWNIKTTEIVAALRAIREAEKHGPVLLHCQHGADRTGMISALYRILYQEWSKDAALAEMQSDTFGYHAVWGNIPAFIRKADVEALRREVERPEHSALHKK